MTQYDSQAKKFLDKTNSVLTIEFWRNGKYFPDDKEDRNIYKFTLKRGERQFTGTFGDSINNTGKGLKPTKYDILSCLTKYNPGTFDDFCSEFGYDTDSKKAETTYQAVTKEYLNLCNLYSEAEMEELAEIN